MSSNCPGDELLIQTAHNSICPRRYKRWEDKSKGISLDLREERGATEPFSQRRWSSRIATATSGKASDRRGITTTQITMTFAEYLTECTKWKTSAIWSTMVSGELNFLPARLLVCVCYYPFVCCGGPAGQVPASSLAPVSQRCRQRGCPALPHGCRLACGLGTGGPWPRRYGRGIQACREGLSSCCIFKSNRKFGKDL